MNAGLLAWVFFASTLASLLFSTLSYALRTISRVQLEEALVIRRRTRAMESILSARFDLALTIPEYFRIIRMKTAALFSAATELAAWLNGATEAVQENLRLYGELLGTAYQIYDDCLDLCGEETKAGKTLGTDLVKGKLTLPVLYLMEDATESQRTQLNTLILRQEPLDLSVTTGRLAVPKKLYIAAMVPLPQKSETNSANQSVVVGNIRVRYTINNRNETNVGSAVKTFEVVNQGNVPCGHAPLCSPDHAWKAASNSVSLDAGPDSLERIGSPLSKSAGE